MQVLELGDEVLEQHVQGPEPENRERVRAVDDEAARADRKRCWHRVDSEDEIRRHVFAGSLATWHTDVRHRPDLALANVAISLLTGLAAVWLGRTLVKSLFT